MVSRDLLHDMYVVQCMSMREIAEQLDCSVNRVSYWLHKHGIPLRTRSEANYMLYNKAGDPFEFKEPDTLYLHKLYGIGIGLYWGEGTKANKNSVRLGNSDPELIKTFLEFLMKIYQIDTSRLKFGLQLFSDKDKDEAIEYWSNAIGFERTYFMKPVVTNQHFKGTYRRKSKYGVVTVYFHNTKLRNILIDSIPYNSV